MDPEAKAQYRYRAVCEVLGGSPVGEVAERYGTTRQSLHTWRKRFEQEGLPGLADRSRRPQTSPTRLPASVEAAICELRRCSPSPTHTRSPRPASDRPRSPTSTAPTPRSRRAWTTRCRSGPWCRGRPPPPFIAVRRRSSRRSATAATPRGVTRPPRRVGRGRRTRGSSRSTWWHRPSSRPSRAASSRRAPPGAGPSTPWPG
uniref:Helix-turn-helix domain-containing protein n=1 Tax=Streptomyces sp. NBC_00003 TaxID=2903608 RepID=A0AAU2UVM1_9ACTN